MRGSLLSHTHTTFSTDLCEVLNTDVGDEFVQVIQLSAEVTNVGHQLALLLVHFCTTQGHGQPFCYNHHPIWGPEAIGNVINGILLSPARMLRLKHNVCSVMSSM